MCARRLGALIGSVAIVSTAALGMGACHSRTSGGTHTGGSASNAGLGDTGAAGESSNNGGTTTSGEAGSGATAPGGTGAGGKSTGSGGSAAGATSSSGAAEGGEASGSGGVNAGGTGNSHGADCPASLPARGPCSQDGVLCSYGDEPSPDCRDRAVCDDGEWVITRASCTSPSPPDECPDPAPASSNACTENGKRCAYGAIICQCVGIGSAGTWTCTPPPNPMTNCPALAPNAGTSCDIEVTCSYSCNQFSENAVSARCVEGVWEWTLMPCSGSGG